MFYIFIILILSENWPRLTIDKRATILHSTLFTMVNISEVPMDKVYINKPLTDKVTIDKLPG